MRFPSLKSMAASALFVISRFPFEILFAIAGTIAATVRVELTNVSPLNENLCWRIIMMANLGLMLSLSISLFTETHIIAGSKRSIFRSAGALLAIGLAYVLNPLKNGADTTRFFLLSFSFHLLVAFAPFIKHGTIQGFWQFNKALFLRFLTSILYSIVLFAGLSAAIGALNFLFNFKFEWDTFSILWFWIAGVFNTMFFLAGVPSDLKILDDDTSYARGLKIFTQFVLIPLATVYLAILLAYGCKILIEWHLPKGMVSSLILCYAVFGILAILLIFPIRNKEENKWIKTYARTFYFLLLPLLVLLFIAVGTRVFKYGVTESRYFLILLAVWLLGISIYFLISAKQNIKLIPISLFILGLFAIYGPQSAFKISEVSQVHILKDIFEKNQYYKDGLLLPVDSNKLPRAEGTRASEVLEYLIFHYDLKSIQPYFKQNLQLISDSLSKQKGHWNPSFPVSRIELQQSKLNWAKSQLHLGKFSTYGYDNLSDTSSLGIRGSSFKIKIENNNITQVSGYNYLIGANSNNFVSVDTPDKDTLKYELDKLTIVKIKENNFRSTVVLNGHALTFNVQTYLDSLIKKTDMKKHLDTAKSGYDATYILPVEALTITKDIDKHRVVLRINQIDCVAEAKTHKNKIIYVGADYLVK